MKEFKPIAQRIVNAEDGFIDYIMNLHGISKDDAQKVLSVYRKLKVIKLDVHIGRFNVVHGAYFDKGAINNAINFKKDQGR